MAILRYVPFVLTIVLMIPAPVLLAQHGEKGQVAREPTGETPVPQSRRVRCADQPDCEAYPRGLVRTADPTQLTRPQLTRPQLILQLSEAIGAFDRGSASLKSAPDEALSAFQEARDKFQGVVAAGIENGQLYYNLGNTHVRLGEIGKAIADYRRAQRLIPNDERLKANLQFARSLRRDQIDASGKRAFLQTVFFWHYSLPLRTRATAAMAGYAVFWLLVGVWLLWRPERVGHAGLVCGVLWLALATSVAIGLPAQSRPTGGVLVANDVVVRMGNGPGYDPQFKEPLHEGVEFEIVEQRGGWLRIELADGNQGWVRDREAELF